MFKIEILGFGGKVEKTKLYQSPVAFAAWKNEHAKRYGKENLRCYRLDGHYGWKKMIDPDSKGK